VSTQRTKEELIKLLNSLKQQPQSGGGESSGTKLTPEQVAYHLSRFEKKKYTNRDEVPMSPRAIAEVERQTERQKKAKKVEK